MDSVGVDGFRKICTDSTRRGLRRIGSAHQLAVTGDGVFTFEDLDYYCVDNLPVELLPEFVKSLLREGNGPSKLAVGIDVRSRHSDLAQLPRWREAVLAQSRDFLDRLGGHTSRKVGTMGYCLGGPIVMRTAAALPERVGATSDAVKASYTVSCTKTRCTEMQL